MKWKETTPIPPNELFIAADSPAFRESVALLLMRGAANMRSLSPLDYVHRCRRLWEKTKTDKFYSRKILFDEILSGNADEFYCATFAEIHVETDATGTHWKEPKDYNARRKPLDWPRFWKDFYRGTPVDKLRELRVANFAKYYDNAIDFVHYSETNRDWFSGELEKQIGTFNKAKPV